MSQVIIQDILPLTQLIASSGQTQFNTTWTADEPSDIIVYQRSSGVPASDEYQQLDPSLYNVTFVGDEQIVRVTLLNGASLGDIITIRRDTPANRLNLYTNTNFTPSMLNQDFGILTLVDQQAQLVNFQVAPHYNYSETFTSTAPNPPDCDIILPQLGANQVWMKNENNTAIVAVDFQGGGGGGGAPADAGYLITQANSGLPDATDLGILAPGLIKNNSAMSVSTISIAIPGTDYWAPGEYLTMPGFPTQPNQCADKAYVDAVASGFVIVSAGVLASTVNIVGTYNNGTAGVGATLTGNSDGALSLDGVVVTATTRVLIKNQSTAADNGIYIVTTVGDVSNPYVLTRAADYDSPSEIMPGTLIFITGGNTQAGSAWVQTNVVATVGTDPINFINFIQPIGGIVPPNEGGTGVDNGSSEITIEGDITFLGAYPFVGNLTASTNITFPTSGTLITIAAFNSPTIYTPNITGVIDGSNAASGSVGQYVTSNVPYASAISLTNGVNHDLTSISLGAGDWDIFGNVNIVSAGVTQAIACWCNTVSATQPDGSLINQINIGSSGVTVGQNTPYLRISSASPVTVYITGVCVFSSLTAKMSGSIFARRIR